MIRIYTIGSRKNSYQDQINEYLKRMSDVVIISVKNEDRIPESYIVLTEEGEQYNSEDFAKYMKRIDAKEINLVIGPAEGFSEKIKNKAIGKISLSPMTYPHELAVLLLVEQIYRAKTILAGMPYHK